jgi:hypothetical protein
MMRVGFFRLAAKRHGQHCRCAVLGFCQTLGDNTMRALHIALTLALALPAAAFAAPVDVRLGANCQSIASAQTIAVDGAHIRVRKGGAVVASGNRQTIYVDDGASASIVGANSMVYVENGGSSTLQTDGNTVYRQKNSGVTSTGDSRVSEVEAFDVWVHEQNSACRKL